MRLSPRKQRKPLFPMLGLELMGAAFSLHPLRRKLPAMIVMGRLWPECIMPIRLNNRMVQGVCDFVLVDTVQAGLYNMGRCVWQLDRQAHDSPLSDILWSTGALVWVYENQG
jgi:hypothetical protein